jgi:hypothetical protein
MLAMLLGEASGWYSANAAVWPDLVVVAPPGGDLGSRLVQALEPVLVQTLVAELAVEALDVAVLHGSPWLDQDVFDAVPRCPGDEGSAGELRAVVCPDDCRVAPESCRPVQQPCDVLSRRTH